MAVKPFNSIDGFSVSGNGNVIIDSAGNITTDSIIVAQNANLGNIANVKIDGGSSGYVIATDGAGNLSFIAGGSGNTSVTSPMPTLINSDETYYVTANHQGLYSVPIEINGALEVDGVLVQVDGIAFDGPTGNTEIFYNDNSVVSGSANLTFNKTNSTLTANNFVATTTANLGAVGNVTITGGTPGQYLQTNGSGGLAWSTVISGSTSNISNGTSNVSIPVVNGNVTISSAGNANIVVVTGTGANITGTLSVTGNANIGNVSTVNLGATGSGSFGANVNMNSYWINNVGYPALANDVATKSYVDTQVSTGITYHEPVSVATTTTLATATGGTTTYNSPNGAANGIGAYISTTGTFLNIDSANIQTVGTRILVKDEANATWNGVYTYANTTAIVRSTDTDEYGPDSTEQISINDYFFVQGGTVNRGVSYVVSAPAGTIIFGTSNIVFSQFSTSQVYTAGTGIAITGTVISANASQTQITAVGTLASLSVSGTATVGNLSITGNVLGNLLPSANITYDLGSATQRWKDLYLSGSSIKLGDATITATGANVSMGSGDVTGANLLTGGILSVGGNANIGNIGTGGLITATGNITGGNLKTTGLANAGSLTVTGVSNLGPVGNVTITGGSSGQYLQTNGSGGLSWASVAAGSTSNISNGTSNVNIATSGGNVTTSVGGTSNVVVVTSTGANITGTLSASGNANVGNLGTGVVTATGNVTGANLVTGGVLSVTGNSNVGNIQATTGIFTTANTSNLNANNTINFTSASNVSLGTVSNVHITGGASGQILTTDGSGALSWVDNTPTTVTYIANSCSLLNGVYVTGDLYSIQVFGDYNLPDGVYTLTDGTGAAPAWIFNVGFTSVANFNQVQMNINYTAASNHTIYVQLYNFATSYTLPSATVSTQVTTNYVTVSSTTNMYVGQTLVFGANVGGLVAGTLYYVLSVVNSTQITVGVGTGSGSIVTLSNDSVTTTVQAQNYDNIGTYTGLGYYYAFALDVIDDTNYINSGAVDLRLFHSNQGNASHTTNIDYVALVLSNQGPQGPKGPTGSTGATGPGVATGGTTGQVLIKNSGTNYDTAWSSNLASLTDITATGNIQAANITATSVLSVTGNANIGNIGTAIVTATGNITGANLVTGGVLSVTGNANIGNIGTAQVLASANITTPQFISNVSTGTAPFLVTSTTQVANLSVATAGSATTADTVTTNAQPNITSTGTLASLSVSGNANIGNIGTTGVLNVTGTGVSTIAGNLDMFGAYIANVHDPVNPQEVATKNYVDTVAQGLHVHASANTGTTGTLAVATGGTVSYNNGSSGVGANLVTTGSYVLIDGFNVANVGTRILVKNEANAAWNGVYTYANSTTIVRATDFDNPVEVAGGDFLFVSSGTTLADTSWVQTTDAPVIIGTSPIVFSQFSGAGTYTAGTGLTLTGSVFSVNDSQTQVTAVGTLTSLSVSGNANIGNIGTSIITATGNITGANLVTGGVLSVTGNANIGNIGTVLITATGNITGANLVTGGVLSVTGNANVGNIGAALHVGNLSGTGNSNVGNLGTGILTATGNITGANLTTGILSATGNVAFSGANVSLGAVANLKITGGTSTYVLSTDGAGNLSWVAQTGGGGASISNGTSNVNIATSGGNILFGVAGVANVVTLDNAGWNYLDGTTQDTGINLGRVTTTAQWWNLP
jgi:hypothetical protein